MPIVFWNSHKSSDRDHARLPAETLGTRRACTRALLRCGSNGRRNVLANLITGAPAMHILLLAMLPPVLSMARGVLRLAARHGGSAGMEVEITGIRLDLDISGSRRTFLALWNTVVALFVR